MNGPSARAQRDGGLGGSLRYKSGTVVRIRTVSGEPLAASFAKKTNIQEHFGEFGHILRIDVSEGQGAVFVEFDDRRDAEDCEETMNEKTICGEPCNVQVASGPEVEPRIVGKEVYLPVQGDFREKVASMARTYRLDEAASARLVDCFRERMRLGCDMERDIQELSDHLAASNKPSALVSMRLAEMRAGRPIGPCKYGSRPATGSFADKTCKEGEELKKAAPPLEAERAEDFKAPPSALGPGERRKGTLSAREERALAAAQAYREQQQQRRGGGDVEESRREGGDQPRERKTEKASSREVGRDGDRSRERRERRDRSRDRDWRSRDEHPRERERSPRR